MVRIDVSPATKSRHVYLKKQDIEIELRLNLANWRSSAPVAEFGRELTGVTAKSEGVKDPDTGEEVSVFQLAEGHAQGKICFSGDDTVNSFDFTIYIEVGMNTGGK